MNVNRNGIIVASANGLNHSKHKKIIPVKNAEKKLEPKTFVTLLREYTDGANEHIIQPYDKDEVQQLKEEGWTVEGVWDKKTTKEPYVTHEH